MKKFQYFIIMGIISNILLTTIDAQEAPQPYLVVSEINAMPVDKEACLIYLKEPIKENTMDVELDTTKSLEEEISTLENAYQELITRISLLESSEDYSLSQAKLGLDQVIQDLYDYYLETHENFRQLTVDEQKAIIENDENYLIWLDYYLQIENELNASLNQKYEIENKMNQLIYLLENENTIIESTHQNLEIINQCSMYAYSVPKFPREKLIIDSQSVSLQDFITKLDRLLSEIVPYPYQKLTFQNIYQIFIERFTGHFQEERFYSKEDLKIDEWAMEKYTYQKELNLLDIEILAYLAKNDNDHQLNKEEYSHAYHKALSLKEKQFEYFYAINEEIWEQLKGIMVDYLNINNLSDLESIEQVKALQSKYQVRLVIFNEQTGAWQGVESYQSGYFQEFAQRDIFDHPEGATIANLRATDSDPHSNIEDDLAKRDGDVMNEDTLKSQLPNNVKSGNVEEKQDSEASRQSSSDIEAIKEKLSRKPNQKTESPNREIKHPVQKENTSKEKANLKLPSTGEKQFASNIAIVLLINGLVLLLIKVIKHRKNVKKLDQIDLE